MYIGINETFSIPRYSFLLASKMLLAFFLRWPQSETKIVSNERHSLSSKTRFTILFIGDILGA